MAIRFLVLPLLLLSTLAAMSQTSYYGTVGTAPIEAVIDATDDGSAQGIYAYTRFDTPITLSGNLKNGALVFTEKNSQGKAAATITFAAFSARAVTASGVWKNLATGQTLPITLNQVTATSGTTRTSPGLLQAASLKNSYFRTVAGGDEGDAGEQPNVVKLFEKKTDRLLQTFSVECQLRGFYSVSVGDFNFDGFEDFAIFEQSFAGPNTSSLYYLYNPTTKRYVPSGFSGVSLEFDAKAKRIYETNSCCAGSSVQKFVYKVVNNRMVQLEEHCYKWDEKTQKLVERKVSACR